MNQKNLLIIPLFLTISIYSQVLEKTKGKASFYSDKLQGRPTISGEKYDKNLLTAAHKTLPFGTMLKVKNLKNNKTVVVKINDRGPHTESRIIDVSRKAAEELDMIRDAIVDVELELLQTEVSTKQSKEPALDSIPQVDDNLSFDEFFDESFDEFKEDDLKFDDNFDPAVKDKDKPSEKTTDSKVTDSTKTDSSVKEEPKDEKHSSEAASISNDKLFYAVQVSSFRNSNTADKFADKLRTRGFPMVYIQKIVYKNRDMYRVLILQYNSKSEAESTMEALKKSGLKPILKNYQFTCK
jgi:rare lipoprotein A